MKVILKIPLLILSALLVIGCSKGSENDPLFYFENGIIKCDESGIVGDTFEINKKIVNTAIYTSWLKGNLVFREASFDNILIKLERHYNVVIINNNNKLSIETFNATIETIEQVLNYFNKVYQIDYTAVENKIIIKL